MPVYLPALFSLFSMLTSSKRYSLFMGSAVLLFVLGAYLTGTQMKPFIATVHLADTCGDGDCEGQETCTSCTLDCGECRPSCGDGSCTGSENCKTCMSPVPHNLHRH